MCDVIVAGAAITAAGAMAASSMSKPKAGAGTASTATSSIGASQQNMVDNAYASANGLLDVSQRSAYNGAYSSGLTQNQTDAVDGLSAYAKGTGSALTADVSNSAKTLLGSTGSYANTAGALAANGAGPAQTNAQGVLNAAANGDTGIANSNAATTPVANQAAQAGYAGAAGSIGNANAMFGQSQQGAAATNAQTVAGAGQFINNDVLNGQIDAVNRDVSRGLNEETLPGLNARAVAGGNLNSSRAGAASAVAARGAADRMADNAAALRGQAYTAGITAAQTNQAQSNALGVAANAQLQNGATIGSNVVQNNTTADQNAVDNKLGAAKAAGALDTSNRALDAQTKLGGNAQQGQAVAQGLGAASQSGNMATQTAGMLSAAGGVQQDEANRQLTEARARIETPQDRQAAVLKDYWAIAGTNPGNGTVQTTGTTSTPANPLGGALGGASLAAGVLQQQGAFNQNTQGGQSTGNNGGFGATGALAGVNNAYQGATGYLGMNGPNAYGSGGYFGQGPFITQ